MSVFHRIICLAAIQFLVLGLSAQTTSSEVFYFASRHCRDSVSAQLKEQIHRTLKLPVSDSTASSWEGAFWAMELMLYLPGGFEERIPEIMHNLPQYNAGFQRAFLEMLYTLYPEKFARELKAQWSKLSTHKNKAMALEYLARAGIFPPVSFTSAFYGSEWYVAYQRRWKQPKPKLPAKADFLDTTFLRRQAVICSFQSPDRNQPGYLMIRDTNHQWLADSLGKPLRFPQLARSVSNLPYYLTNGNTPQGMYRILGKGSSSNPWIGPTANLQLVLPFEQENAFFEKDTAYYAFYKRLLGPKMNRFAGLWESYTAGKAGRTEIIAHGTTIDPAFYQGKTYYPHTPSLGCLCSPESWNAQGERIYSAQQEWMDALQKSRLQPLWLIVAEVSDISP